jgi:hypothetical protein
LRVDYEDAGVCAFILTSFSFILFLVTMPVSLFMCVKVCGLPESL